ncbi:polysaccharide biosynthesis/export family protein [Bacteroides sp.]
MKIKTITVAILIVLLTSCKTSNPITYFQDIDQTVSGQLMEENVNYEAKICPDDQLSISVSSIDPNAIAIFNLPLSSYQTPSETNVVTTPVLQTYLVDSEGNINFPVLGKIKVIGKTRREVSAILEEQITAYAKSPLVIVKILNFKVSILGEVNSPGTKVFSGERISILDAISSAGDLTLYGERNNILLIRDINGRKEYQRLNLTSSTLFSSPYYYLQQNDVIYVEPNKARKGNARYSQSAQFNISVASTIVSAISVIASLAIALLVK